MIRIELSADNDTTQYKLALSSMEKWEATTSATVQQSAFPTRKVPPPFRWRTRSMTSNAPICLCAVHNRAFLATEDKLFCIYRRSVNDGAIDDNIMQLQLPLTDGR